MRVLLSIFLGVFISFAVYAQSQTDTTFQSDMRLRAGLNIGCEINMKFPDRVAGKAYTSVLGSDDGVQYAGFDAGHNAQCKINGEEGATVDVVIPGTSWDMSQGSDVITISSFEINSAATPNQLLGATLGSSGLDLEIEGFIDTMPGGLPTGSYVNSGITIEVEYQ